MNNKALLLAVFAATFSAATFTFANEVTIIVVEENQETTTHVKPLATIKKVIDQEILSYCKENDIPLCQQFLAYAMAYTDSIDLDADAAIIFDKVQNDLKAELNNLAKVEKEIIAEIKADAQNIAKEIHEALEKQQ